MAARLGGEGGGDRHINLQLALTHQLLPRGALASICPASSFCKTNNKEEEEEKEEEDDQQNGEKLLDLASPFSAALLQIVATVTRGGLD